MKTITLAIFATLLLLTSCNNTENLADAYGNFESTDQLVSAEMPGKLVQFTVEEGMHLKSGEIAGMIDTTTLHLTRNQVLASVKAIRGKLQDPGPQIRLIEKQISVMSKEQRRVYALVTEEAATQKQLDDIDGQIEILKQQIETTQAQSRIANNALLSQIAPLQAQIESIDEQISRCKIINPVEGTVLLKLAQPGEMVSPARALYKIADISRMELRAYISGEQLPHISIGQEVWVEIDENAETNKRLPGTISWISDRAEFTPKTIQTKEERVNLVYALKVVLPNEEGILKIGMPGEVHFKAKDSAK